MEQQRIKVLQLYTELNLACGVSRTISQLIKNSSIEIEHHIIALGGDGLIRFESFNFKPTIINHNRFSIAGTFKIFFYLFNYCKKYSIQILHSHHRYFDTLTWLIKFIIKIKTITSVHSEVYDKKIFSYKSDKLIACSMYIKNHLESRFQINKERIKVIYNSVTLISEDHIAEKKNLLEELNIKENILIVGYVGRINIREKGIDILIKAFKKLSTIKPDVFLIIVGKGEDDKEIRKILKSNSLSALVLPSKNNILDYINLMDIFILPSRVEPFGIVLLEAGIVKTNVIASNIGGIPEIIQNEYNGLLFENENVNQLTNCLLRFINNGEISKKLANNLYGTVTEKFPASKMVEQYQNEYKKLLENNGV